jgi:hypothetical protein
MTFNQYLQSVEACEPAVEWAGNKTIEEVVATCDRGDWLLWLAQECDIGLQPLTLVKGHCANTVRHLMKDERSIKAVDVAIAFGEGKATRQELDDAYDDAYDAAAYRADYATAYAADSATAAAADDDADDHDASDAADHAAAAAAAAYDADDDNAAVFDANYLQTADICRKYIGGLIIEKVNQILTQTS